MQPWTESLLKRLTSGSVHAGVMCVMSIMHVLSGFCVVLCVCDICFGGCVLFVL